MSSDERDDTAAATRPMTAAEAAALLNRPALEEMAVADDGFYNARFRSNQALTWYNRMLLDEIPRLPAFPEYHEIGGGVGVLPIALSMLGMRTVNIDHLEARLVCGERILTRMDGLVPGLARRVTMIRGSFPEAVADRDCSQACAITTNLASGDATNPATREDTRAFLEAVASRYGAFVFDVCLLCANWRETGAWREILDLCRRVFGREPQLFHTKREDYARYYFVDFRRNRQGAG